MQDIFFKKEREAQEPQKRKIRAKTQDMEALVSSDLIAWKVFRPKSRAMYVDWIEQRMRKLFKYSAGPGIKEQRLEENLHAYGRQKAGKGPGCRERNR